MKSKVKITSKKYTPAQISKLLKGSTIKFDGGKAKTKK